MDDLDDFLKEMDDMLAPTGAGTDSETESFEKAQSGSLAESDLMALLGDSPPKKGTIDMMKPTEITVQITGGNVLEEALSDFLTTLLLEALDDIETELINEKVNSTMHADMTHITGQARYDDRYMAEAAAAAAKAKAEAEEKARKEAEESARKEAAAAAAKAKAEAEEKARKEAEESARKEAAAAAAKAKAEAEEKARKEAEESARKEAAAAAAKAKAEAEEKARKEAEESARKEAAAAAAKAKAEAEEKARKEAEESARKEAAAAAAKAKAEAEEKARKESEEALAEAAAMKARKKIEAQSLAMMKIEADAAAAKALAEAEEIVKLEVANKVNAVENAATIASMNGSVSNAKAEVDDQSKIELLTGLGESNEDVFSLPLPDDDWGGNLEDIDARVHGDVNSFTSGWRMQYSALTEAYYGLGKIKEGNEFNVSDMERYEYVNIIECVMRPDVSQDECIAGLVGLCKPLDLIVARPNCNELVVLGNSSNKSSAVSNSEDLSSSTEALQETSSWSSLLSIGGAATSIGKKLRKNEEWDILDAHVCISRELKQRVFLLIFMKDKYAATDAAEAATAAAVAAATAIASSWSSALTAFGAAAPGVTPKVKELPWKEDPRCLEVLLDSIKRTFSRKKLLLSSLYDVALSTVCRVPEQEQLGYYNYGLDVSFVGQLHSLMGENLRLNIQEPIASLKDYLKLYERNCAAFVTMMKPVIEKHGIEVPQFPTFKELKQFPLKEVAAKNNQNVRDMLARDLTTPDVITPTTQAVISPQPPSNTLASIFEKGAQKSVSQDSHDDDDDDFNMSPLVKLKDVQNSPVKAGKTYPAKSSEKRKDFEYSDGMAKALYVLGQCISDVQEFFDDQMSAQLEQRNQYTVDIVTSLFAYKKQLVAAIVDNKWASQQSDIGKAFAKAFGGSCEELPLPPVEDILGFTAYAGSGEDKKELVSSADKANSSEGADTVLGWATGLLASMQGGDKGDKLKLDATDAGKKNKDKEKSGKSKAELMKARLEALRSPRRELAENKVLPLPEPISISSVQKRAEERALAMASAGAKKEKDKEPPLVAPTGLGFNVSGTVVLFWCAVLIDSSPGTLYISEDHLCLQYTLGSAPFLTSKPAISSQATADLLGTQDSADESPAPAPASANMGMGLFRSEKLVFPLKKMGDVMVKTSSVFGGSVNTGSYLTVSFFEGNRTITITPTFVECERLRFLLMELSEISSSNNRAKRNQDQLLIIN